MKGMYRTHMEAETKRRARYSLTRDFYKVFGSVITPEKAWWLYERHGSKALKQALYEAQTYNVYQIVDIDEPLSEDRAREILNRNKLWL